MTTVSENQPCPFCGGTVDSAGWLREDGTRGPECSGCGATAVSAAAWNRRSTDTQQDAETATERGELGRLLREWHSIAVNLRGRLNQTSVLVQSALGVQAADALDAKDAEITRLRAEIEALKHQTAGRCDE